jgi:hypothetical protein
MLGFRPHRVVVNTIGTVHVACCNGATAEFKMTSGAAATNSGAYLRKIPSGCLQERLNASLRLRIVGGDIHEHADATHRLGLLRARREPSWGSIHWAAPGTGPLCSGFRIASGPWHARS